MLAQGSSLARPPQMKPETVILVHGFLDRPGIFWRMRRYLARRGHRVHAVALRPSSGATGLEALAGQVKAHVDRLVPPDERCSIVAFSMGGLVVRYYLQRLNGLGRVRRFATVSTPHNGTLVAWLVGGLGCRQMRPGSTFHADLNADCHLLAPTAPLSLWTPFDLTILPPSSSVVPGFCNRRILVVHHALMVWSLSVLRAVAGHLAVR